MVNPGGNGFIPLWVCRTATSRLGCGRKKACRYICAVSRIAHVAPVLAKNDDSDWQLDMKAYSENSMYSPLAVTRLEEQTEEFNDAPARWHLKTSYHVQPNYHIPQPSQIGSARKSESSRQIGATIGTAVHRALERYAEWIDLD